MMCRRPRARVGGILRAAFLAGSLLAASVVGAGEQSAGALTLPQLLSAMSSVREQRAEFVEEKHLALLDKPLRVSGTLEYRRPDFLERRTDPPADEIMNVAGDRLTIAWPSRHEQRTLALSSNPVAWAFVESVRATLAGDRGALERFYWVTLSGDMRRWSLTLEPRASFVASYVTTVILSGGGSMIEQVDVLQANGDRSVMEVRPLAERSRHQDQNPDPSRSPP